jgi:hypothetical protein
MRTRASSQAIPLLALTCLLILTCSVLADAQEVQRPAPTTQIGTITPEGKEFRVELNEEQLSRLYPQSAAQQVNARRGKPTSKEEFRQSVLSDVLRKIRTLFPTGVPEGAASRIKIRITVKLSDPPEFGLSVEW